MQTIRESSTQAVPMSLKTLRKKNLYLENICLCLVIDRQRRIADDTAHGYQDGSSGTGRTTTRLTCNPGKQCSQGKGPSQRWHRANREMQANWNEELTEGCESQLPVTGHHGCIH